MPPALLTAVDCSRQVHLIIGSNPLAGSRCARSIEVGAVPILIAPEGPVVHRGILKRVDDGQVQWLRREFHDDDLTNLGREEVRSVVDVVFLTLGAKNPQSARIVKLCRELRIPVNVADAPLLSSFTILSTHTDGPLQIGVTTSGSGCKLSSRIRREIASSLPANIGSAVSRLGSLRRQLWEEDKVVTLGPGEEAEAEEEDTVQPANFNKLVTPEDHDAARTRRIRWLSQICEYWPIKRLASISDSDVSSILTAYRSAPSTFTSAPPDLLTPQPTNPRKPQIILAGSGPGSPELLTRATYTAIKTATIILADKLVPAPVLDLIPRRTTVHIARKFPGNADAAQDELLQLGIAGLQAGHTVLRLKQGDPFLYGRGGEEVLWFRERGWEPLVLPGVTSALAAPLFAGVPVTQRGVADQVLVCTGVGRKGKETVPPEFGPSRTVIFLMALNRLASLVEQLVGTEAAVNAEGLTNGVDPPHKEARWPTSTPVAIVERASCADQRVIRSTLEHVVAAVEELGSQPPGLLVLGAACAALKSIEGKWVVEEGCRDMAEFERLLEGVGELEEVEERE
ncbi:siroheme synthase [Trichodelitschia bisporula]|uniref:Siroheme synthase n=1 Tax=Trichodelitschia bisporula TaxID=703511 RepID=A0A6G1HP32_9PEZI|nr:siroheme synthase [Trichodelitschia bisporula]